MNVSHLNILPASCMLKGLSKRLSNTPVTVVPHWTICFTSLLSCHVLTPFHFPNSKLWHLYPSPAPGNKFPLTANIFPETPAVNPSTCLAYCSTCLEFNSVSNLPGSCGNLNSRCHSSSGNGLCFANALLAFSDFRFCCQAVILVCSRASCL